MMSQMATGVARECEVPSAIGAMEKHLGEFDELLSRLIGRIEPVLRPSVPTPDMINKAREEQPIESPLASQINSFNLRMRNYITRIQDALNRLEL